MAWACSRGGSGRLGLRGRTRFERRLSAAAELLQAERALRRLGAARPSWLDAAYYQEKVARAVERSPLARAVDGTLE